VLCEHALINAYADQQRPVPARLVDEVAREFELDSPEPTAPPRAAVCPENSRAAESRLEGLLVLLDGLRQPTLMTAQPGERKE